MLQSSSDSEDQDFENNEIYKRNLRRFFSDLRQQAHHIYALLDGAPKSVFWIVLDNDDLASPEQAFALKEFYANLSKFHDNKDTFRVYFKAYFFRDEWDVCVPGWELMDNAFTGDEQFEICDTNELSVAVLEKEWPHVLAYLCREAILSNKPFRLDDETPLQYGFTRQDISLLQEPVARFNAKIIDELREQYDKLAAIDCLHHTRQ